MWLVIYDISFMQHWVLTPADEHEEKYFLKKSFIEYKRNHYEDLDSFTQHPKEGSQEKVMQ